MAANGQNEQPAVGQSADVSGSLETEILLYLYNHPDGDHETASLAFNLRAPIVAPGELPTFDEAYTQKQQQDMLAMQHAVEGLILAELLQGKRTALGSGVQFTGLTLTKRGEAEAIRVKRNLHELPADSH